VALPGSLWPGPTGQVFILDQPTFSISRGPFRVPPLLLGFSLLKDNPSRDGLRAQFLIACLCGAGLMWGIAPRDVLRWGPWDPDLCRMPPCSGPSRRGLETPEVPYGQSAGRPPLRAAAARFGGRDGRMLAARVEPKNGTWKRMKKPAGQICKALRLRPCSRMSQRIIPPHSVGPLD
jgi:hypothetical protein